MSKVVKLDGEEAFEYKPSKEAIRIRNENKKNALRTGLSQAKAGESRPIGDVITDIKRDIREWTK